MVSKTKLQEELSSFNKQLDKHLQGVGVDMLSDLSISSSSLPSDQYEQLLLLTQSLKDIRMEMNLMRKHMASDTEVMLKSLMTTQQKQFRDEMREFQEKTFSILKVFDPSQLKEITSEINRVSSDQRELKEEMKKIQSSIDSLATSATQHDELDLKLLLEPYFMEVNSKHNELESHIEHLFSKEKMKFENFEMILKDSLLSMQQSIERKQELAIKTIPNSKKDLEKLSKKLEKIDQLSKETKIKVSEVTKDISKTKKELLNSTAQSENLLYKQLTSFEDRISNFEESHIDELNKKLSQINKELSSTKREVLESSAQSENLLYKQMSSFEDRISKSQTSHDSQLAKKISEITNISGEETLKNHSATSTPPKNNSQKVIDITSLATIEKDTQPDRNTHEKLLDIDSRIKKLSSLK